MVRPSTARCRLDPGVSRPSHFRFHHLRPLDRFGADQRGEFFGSVVHALSRKVFQLLIMPLIAVPTARPHSWKLGKTRRAPYVFPRDRQINPAAKSEGPVGAPQSGASTRRERRTMHIMLIPLRYAAPQGRSERVSGKGCGARGSWFNRKPSACAWRSRASFRFLLSGTRRTLRDFRWARSRRPWTGR